MLLVASNLPPFAGFRGPPSSCSARPPEPRPGSAQWPQPGRFLQQRRKGLEARAEVRSEQRDHSRPGLVPLPAPVTRARRPAKRSMSSVGSSRYTARPCPEDTRKYGQAQPSRARPLGREALLAFLAHLPPRLEERPQ